MNQQTNEELENKWREEFDVHHFEGSHFHRESPEANSLRNTEAYRCALKGYLISRKKGQKEIEKRDRLIEKLRYSLKSMRDSIIDGDVYMKKELRNELLKEVGEL